MTCWWAGEVCIVEFVESGTLRKPFGGGLEKLRVARLECVRKIVGMNHIGIVFQVPEFDHWKLWA